jgi:hypothetical protein
MATPAEIIMQKGIKPPFVSPNSVIDTKAPKGIKEFTLTCIGNKENNSDSYRIPSEKAHTFITFTVYGLQIKEMEIFSLRWRWSKC